MDKDNKQNIADATETSVATQIAAAVEDLSSNEVAQATQLSQLPASNLAKKKRFQVDIFDQVSYGEPPMEQIKLEKVHYDNPVIIEASCKQDLQDFAAKLALCKQTFKIVKVLDDVSVASTQQQMLPQAAQQQSQMQTQVQPVMQRSKPKYYKVGDIELKDDNGKIYQKQWLRLTDSEASNFRIINDKTNSIFNLKDRHIEMKKWVLVDSTDDATDLEKII